MILNGSSNTLHRAGNGIADKCVRTASAALLNIAEYIK